MKYIYLQWKLKCFDDENDEEFAGSIESDDFDDDEDFYDDEEDISDDE